MGVGVGVGGGRDEIFADGVEVYFGWAATVSRKYLKVSPREKDAEG